MSILVIAAHPDDEVLGCGATMAALSAHEEVHVALLGEGLTARVAQRETVAAAQLEQLQIQSRAAAEVLNAQWMDCAGLPDNRFDTVPLLDIVKHVERWIESVRPRAVYTHHPGDLNVDHAATFRAVLTATRPMQGCPVKELYTFEIPSSTEWAFQKLQPAFLPNVFQDVTATMDAKVEALKHYTDEVRKFPHPRSAEALRAIAQRWGSVIGAEYAEAFELIRWIR